jgi:hypothetical protein
MRSLFVYWKVPAEHAGAAIDAARRWQAALRSAHAGLQVTLFQRSDAGTTGSGVVTLMETFALPEGLPPELDAALLGPGDTALAELARNWAALPPRRHVEAFDALPR